MPASIGNLTKLTQLRLSGNSLSGAWYDQTYPNENETVLTIACTGALPKMMPPSLEVLSMRKAGKFTGGIPSEWGSLTNLKKLNLSKCGLDGACSCMTSHTQISSRARAQAPSRHPSAT